MFTFTSAYKKHTIMGKPTSDKQLDYVVHFLPVGGVGQFTTEDEKLAEKLRNHPDFNKKFTEIGLGLKAKSNVVDGVRSSATQGEVGKEAIDPQEYINFGVLKNKLLKNDGSYRKDASEDEIKQYETLKQKLGE